MSIRQLVMRSGLGSATIERAIASGKLRSSRVGRRRLIRVEDFDAWVSPDDEGIGPGLGGDTA